MKRQEILGMMLASILLLSSCEKYLNINSSNERTLLTSAAECQMLLDNNGRMNYGYISEANLVSDDYYANPVELFSADVQADERSIYLWESSAIRSNAEQWQEPYNTIYQNNVVLETVEKIRENGGTDGATLDGLRGAALFYRAFTFWQLAQIYAKPYSATAGQDAGIPLRLASDISIKSQRGTVAQTYDRIIADLQEASSLLQPTSIVPTRPNRAAAFAMLARVYLSMGDYAKALSSTDEALKLKSALLNFNDLDKESDVPFVQYNKEMIFHAVARYSILLRPDLYARIDEGLVASYAAGDLRKEILVKPNKETRTDPETGENYKDADGNEILFNTGTYRFTGNYEPNNSSEQFIGLAVDEIYLIRAECEARAGNTAAALADLNTLMATRWQSGMFTAITAGNADEALVKVLAERRKELLMRGLRWSDLRRLNQEARFAKILTKTIEGVTYTLPPNDLRYTLLIPQSVIMYGGLAQNPR